MAVAGLAPKPAPAGWPPESDLAEFAAVLHVHSAYSHDARGTRGGDRRRRRAAPGSEVVFLTDHNTLAPLAEGKEGWYGRHAGPGRGRGHHRLGVPPAPGPARPMRRSRPGASPSRTWSARWRENGRLVYLAHPEHPRLGWRDEVPDVDGLEIVDVFDQVIGAPLARQVMGLLAYPANPVMAILSVLHWPTSVLARWDAMAGADGPRWASWPWTPTAGSS